MFATSRLPGEIDRPVQTQSLRRGEEEEKLRVSKVHGLRRCKMRVR